MLCSHLLLHPEYSSLLGHGSIRARLKYFSFFFLSLFSVNMSYQTWTEFFACKHHVELATDTKRSCMFAFFALY